MASRVSILRILAVLLALGLVGAAQPSVAQNSVVLEATPDVLGVGEPFEVSVAMSFGEATTGGGVTFVYDPSRVSLDAVVFAGGLGADPDFGCPGSTVIACPMDPAYLSFGSVTGLTGMNLVATATFTALANGQATILLQPSSAFGGIGGDPLTVVLTGTSVTIGAGVPSLSFWGLSLLAMALAGAALRHARASKRLGSAAGLALLFALVLMAPEAGAQGAMDTDLDGIDDSVDNCVDVANADQRDSNADGYGNFCDGDLDNDLDVDAVDLDAMKAAFFGADPDADLNGDGTVDYLDLGIIALQYGGGPGPKCGFCPIAPGSGSFSSVPAVPVVIPDGGAGGAADSNSIAQNATILNLEVLVQISHSWVGDLKVTLSHVETGTTAVLIDRPGSPASSSFGCSGDDIDATLADDASLPAEDECASGSPAIAGFLLPTETLAVFNGEDIAGTWTLTVYDLGLGVSGTLDAWTLELNDPPLLPEVSLTAYRPLTESYGNPLVRRAIPDHLEEIPGAGIRMNGDDDDNDLIADRDDVAVVGENDMIEVEIGVNQVPPPPGVEYVLRRSNSNIKVWNDSTKGSAVLDTADEVVLNLASLVGSLWVENTDGGSAALELEAREIVGGLVLASDLVEFYTFTSLIIGLHGEFQFATDPVFGPNEGISYLTIDFHEDGFDAHMFEENDVASDGSGRVYDEIVNAVLNRGVTCVAIFGFSHGGGSIYDLSELLAANAASIGPFDICFTGYIDSIENDSDADLDPEIRRPLGSAYHVNMYQSNWFWWIWGDSVPGSDVDVNVTNTIWGGGLSHISITTHANVQAGISVPLLLRVDR
ncbi:MAG: proprotein convertase P-domain-containing protein [Myxococcota bacterium]|nr:proprotein convertase P-domain-containing protein [Myxococcota bacterium]